MADWLSTFVLSRMSDAARAGPRAEAWVNESGGMILYGSIGVEAVLRPDGSVWLYELEELDQEGTWRQATDNERMGALVIGARRIPEIRRLIPARPTSSPDCSRCAGTGNLIANVICPECSGLGWVSEGAA